MVQSQVGAAGRGRIKVPCVGCCLALCLQVYRPGSLAGISSEIMGCSVCMDTCQGAAVLSGVLAGALRSARRCKGKAQLEGLGLNVLGAPCRSGDQSAAWLW